MIDTEQLVGILEELITTLQIQAVNLERLMTHVEQVTTHLPQANEISIVRSQLAGLHLRVRKLLERA